MSYKCFLHLRDDAYMQARGQLQEQHRGRGKVELLKVHFEARFPKHLLYVSQGVAVTVAAITQGAPHRVEPLLEGGLERELSRIVFDMLHKEDLSSRPEQSLHIIQHR